jgi:hypothetical protein
MVDYFGAQPRYGDRELRVRVAAARAAAERVAFEHVARGSILDAFVEVYREMESDRRLDGSCHVLAEHDVANELHVGGG